MQELGQLVMHIVRWTFHLWWVWCLLMLATIPCAILLGKTFGKSGKSNDEGR
jgi:hypothetical protein